MTKIDQRNREKGGAGRCTKQSNKKRYSKKRKGKKKTQKADKNSVPSETAENQHLDITIEPAQIKTITTASTEKVTDIKTDDNREHSTISGFRFLEMSILSKVLSLLACPSCKNVCCLELSDVSAKKLGFSSFLRIKCDVCDFLHEFYTSPQVSTSLDKRRRGKNAMEINVRTIYSFRNIGIGHVLILKLCGYLNMPPPMAKDSYDHTANRIKVACKQVAEKSMSEAAADLRKSETTADVGVLVDGTWQ